MSELIRKARANDNRDIEVKIPIYLYSEDATFKEYIDAEPINKVKNESDSILSLLGGGETYTDISGMTLLMVAWDGGKKYKNEVIVKGRTANWIIVEIGGNEYSVYKTRVIFTKRD